MFRRINGRKLRKWLSGKSPLAKLVGLKTKDREQFLWQGYAHLEKGDFVNAARIYDLAVTFWPDLPEPLLGQGACRQASGDLIGAEHSYSALLDKAPKNPYARANRAEVCLLLGRIEEARADLAAISTDSDLGELRQRISELTEKAGLSDR